AWHGGIDMDGTGKVDEADFVRGLQHVEVSVKNPKRLFKALLARYGQRSISIEDLQALLIGVPPPERAAIWVGTGSAGQTGQDLGGNEGDKTPASPTNISSLMSYGGEISPKQHAERVRKEFNDQDIIIRTIDDFKRILVNRFGSLFSAWRYGLDVDHNGILTYFDFATACRNMGIKDIKKLWAELDVNKSGQISLYEVDPEVAEPFAMLESLMVEKYGSTKAAWAKTFNKDKSLRCDLPKFVKELQDLGFTGDAERFFKLLRPEPGRPYLTYEDLWLNLDMNNFRKPGEEPLGSPLGTASPSNSKPSSPTSAADRRSGPTMFKRTDEAEDETS
ncbi:unnamed protein product, partial [Polarella glacialis]